MKKYSLLSFFLFQCTTISVIAEISPYVITFFIRPLPLTYRPINPDKAERTISSAQKIIKTLIKKEINELHLYSGIYVNYAGMFAVSDMNGQVTFSRKAAEPKLHLLVTEDLKAAPLNPHNNKTLLGFLPDPKAPLQYYAYERKLDPETELYSWVVTEEPFPKNKRVPLDTIVIIANPKHIVVPMGTTHAIESENLILPDIFTTHNLNSALNALRFLKLRQYFAPVKMEYKFIPDGYQQRLQS